MNGVNGLKQPAVTCQPTSDEIVTNNVTKLNDSSPKITNKSENTFTEICSGVESLTILMKNKSDLDGVDNPIQSNGLKQENQTESVLITETNVPLEIKSNNLLMHSNNGSLDSVSKKHTEDSHKPELCSENVKEKTHVGLLELEHITTNSFESNVKSEDISEEPLKDPLSITDNGASNNLNNKMEDVKEELCDLSETEGDSQDEESERQDSQDEESERQDSQDDNESERLDAQKDVELEGQNSHDTLSLDSDSDIEDLDDLPYSSSEVTSDEVIVLDESGPSTYVKDSSLKSLKSDLKEIEDIPKVAAVQESTLRRSSRAVVKRTLYDLSSDNDECDYDDIILEQPKHQSRPIFIRSTKSLVEMSKQIKPKKEPTIVIIDETIKTQRNSNLIQNMAFRGTTVTPIEKPILPSLTDDMFVVEAPSFIVPYVYEKPSIEPFREFVDKLGETIKEQEKKEQKEKLEKELSEKAEKAEERRLKKENGEEVSESEDESVKVQSAEEEKKLKKEEKKENRKMDDDDATWDGESSSDSEDITDEEDKSLELINETPIASTSTSTADNYFAHSLGQFFMDIGYNLVQEYVQTDLLKSEKRKLSREKKANRSTKETEQSIVQLNNNLELTKQKNAPFKSEMKKCEQCNFKSESMLVISNHMETPHMKNNMYTCNFCTFISKSPTEIFTHTQSIHGLKGKVERPPPHHQCPNCQYEDNSKGKLARHMVGCTKRFKPESLLAPPTEWEPPAKIPKITTKSRNQMMGTFINPFNRGQMGTNVNRPIGNSIILGTIPFRQRARVSNIPSRLCIPAVPIRGPLTIRPIHRVPLNNNITLSPVKHQPSLSITPLPRQPKPRSNKVTCVVCEICDGYIVDLEQLRIHMQSVHNVKIHPKMIQNRPPLNCQKCNYRSFTDQGLERHLLGVHGLVTRSMQESANNGKDSGRCPICGKVYQMKLLAHVGRDHKKILKPAHLSYKCTVCTATFGMYKQFENHVYSAHSAIARRAIDRTNSNIESTSSQSDSTVNIRDETTITPLPATKSTQDPK